MNLRLSILLIVAFVPCILAVILELLLSFMGGSTGISKFISLLFTVFRLVTLLLLAFKCFLYTLSLLRVRI